jgi:hypothetical protein
MSTTSQSIPLRSPSTTTAPLRASRRPLSHVLILLGLWLAIFVAALSTPPLLDDADATHAQAAQAMLTTGDWVTLHVDGIRYLEKPPLPYWLTAISLRLFAPKPPYAHSQAAESRAAFAVHLPLALTILGLALLGYALPPHLHRRLPLHPRLHPRRPPLPPPRLRPLRLPPLSRPPHQRGCPIHTRLHRGWVGFAEYLALRHLDVPGPGRPHQGPRRPRLLLRHHPHLPHLDKPAPPLATSPPRHWHPPFPSDRRTLAHPRRPPQHRRRQRPRLLLVLLHQRARTPLLRPPHPPRLQQAPRLSLLVSPPSLALPLEPLRPRRPPLRLAQPPRFIPRPIRSGICHPERRRSRFHRVHRSRRTPRNKLPPPPFDPF